VGRLVHARAFTAAAMRQQRVCEHTYCVWSLPPFAVSARDSHRRLPLGVLLRLSALPIRWSTCSREASGVAM